MGRVCSLICFMLVILARATETAAQGQGMWRPTTAPEVTAVGEPWLLSREPIFYAGEFYYPAGPTVFFNGTVMAPVGFHRGVPLYENTSEMPFTVIYVPVGSHLMRPYERRRDSLAPARIPDEPPADILPVGTVGVSTTAIEPAAESEEAVSQPAPRSGRSRADVWIEYQGARWYVSGPGRPYHDNLFRQVGTYRGLPVYRHAQGGDELFVTIVADGPVTPFKRR